MTHKKVENFLLVRHNQTLHFVTFRASGRPHYVTCKQELLVFRAVTAFRCESDDSESDLTPIQEEVIVVARCGYLLYTFTNIIHTLLHLLISYFSTSAFIPHQSMSNDKYRKGCAFVIERQKYTPVGDRPRLTAGWVLCETHCQ